MLSLPLSQSSGYVSVQLITACFASLLESLQEAERKRRLEEAIVHRKRSSRIAIKESEKEEARLAAKKRAEEEEKLARLRRAEARAKKEEEEREKRELAREQRRREREEREERARAKAERGQNERYFAISPWFLMGCNLMGVNSTDVDVVSQSSKATPALNGTHSNESVQLSRIGTPNGVRSPDWVLDCEICHKSGINLVRLFDYNCVFRFLFVLPGRTMANRWCHAVDALAGSTSPVTMQRIND